MLVVKASQFDIVQERCLWKQTVSDTQGECTFAQTWRQGKHWAGATLSAWYHAGPYELLRRSSFVIMGSVASQVWCIVNAEVLAKVDVNQADEGSWRQTWLRCCLVDLDVRESRLQSRKYAEDCGLCDRCTERKRVSVAV